MSNRRQIFFYTDLWNLCVRYNGYVAQPGCEKLKKGHTSLGEETASKMVKRMSDLKMEGYHQDETYENELQGKNG